MQQSQALNKQVAHACTLTVWAAACLVLLCEAGVLLHVTTLAAATCSSLSSLEGWM